MKHFAGNYYHIYNRGIDDQNIFAIEENYHFLIRRIQKYLPIYPVTLAAFCLMPNHYHFLLYAEQDGAPGRFIQRLFNSYTQAFNVQQKRKGPLFESRAKSKLVFENEYLFQITRYIHLNPVSASLVARPEDWPFSNYREFIGTQRDRLFDVEFLETQFSSSEEYKLFVEAGIQQKIHANIQKYCFD
jgi:putative transposase